jgi:hypothetical protein
MKYRCMKRQEVVTTTNAFSLLSSLQSTAKSFRWFHTDNYRNVSILLYICENCGSGGANELPRFQIMSWRNLVCAKHTLFTRSICLFHILKLQQSYSPNYTFSSSLILIYRCSGVNFKKNTDFHTSLLFC